MYNILVLNKDKKRKRIQFKSTIIVYSSNKLSKEELKLFKKEVTIMEAIRRRKIRTERKLAKHKRFIREYEEE